MNTVAGKMNPCPWSPAFAGMTKDRKSSCLPLAARRVGAKQPGATTLA